jgi:hypothetical protein
MVVVRCGDESHEKLEKSETVFSSFSYLVSLSPLSLSLSPSLFLFRIIFFKETRPSGVSNKKNFWK